MPLTVALDKNIHVQMYFLVKHKILQLLSVLYSTDWTSRDFFLFFKQKIRLKRKIWGYQGH